jgi:hypothetical protein
MQLLQQNIYQTEKLQQLLQSYSFTAAFAKVQHYQTGPQYVETSNDLKINPYLHQTRQGWENVDGRIYLLNSNKSMLSFRIFISSHN